MRPSLDDVCRWAPLLLFAAHLLLTLEIRPHDLWWHLRSGQLALEQGQLSRIDQFSFTRSGEVWVNQSWGMQIALYELFRIGGLALVLIGHALCVTGGYAALLAALRRVHGTVAALFAGSTAFLLGAKNMGVRPQSVSFLCFGTLMAAIELHRSGRPLALRGAPLLFALWANAHGGFVFGGAALGLYVLGRTWELRAQLHARRTLQELWLIGGASFAALVLTPEGVRGLVAYFEGFFAHGLALAAVEEFQPLQIRTLDGLLFFAVLAATVAALWRSGVRPAPDQIAMLCAFGLAALSARRFVGWYGFVLAPVLATATARLAGPALRSVGDRRRNALYLALALAVLAAAPLLRARVYGRPWLNAETPVEAIASLCQVAPDSARVFADTGFASYQIFACPRLRVFADTRVELYPQALWEEYLAVAAGRYDWESILARHEVTHLVVPAEGAFFAGLRAAVGASGHWRELHRDGTAIVWTRGPSSDVQSD